MKEKNYDMQDNLVKKLSPTHVEFMKWLNKIKKTKPSSAKHHFSCLNIMLSLIFGTEKSFTTAQRLNGHAIANHQI
ncbi:MAG: hypothetical protein EZS28_039784, partial [Streblomastix strix]